MAIRWRWPPQRQPALADARGVAVGQALDEVVGLRLRAAASISSCVAPGRA